MRTVTCLAVCLACLLPLLAGVSASAETIKYSQPPAAMSQSVSYKSIWNFGPIGSDDWDCTTGLPVVGFRWWGAFCGCTGEMPPLNQPYGWYFAIYADIPANPGDPESYSRPGAKLWEYHGSGGPEPTRVGVDISGASVFEFNAGISPENWFYQPDGHNILWLTIQAKYMTVPADDDPDGGPFKWLSRSKLFMDDAIWAGLPLDNKDFTFEIKTVVVPEPTSATTIAVALAGLPLLRRRRRH